MLYYIDGNNIGQWKAKGIIDQPTLLTLFVELRNKGHNYVCFFDANIHRSIERQNEEDVFKKYVKDFKVVPSGSQADPFIILCASNDNSSIISNDTYRHSIDKYPWLKRDAIPQRLFKGMVVNSMLMIPDLDINKHIESDVYKLLNQLGYYSSESEIREKSTIPIPAPIPKIPEVIADINNKADIPVINELESFSSLHRSDRRIKRESQKSNWGGYVIALSVVLLFVYFIITPYFKESHYQPDENAPSQITGGSISNESYDKAKETRHRKGRSQTNNSHQENTESQATNTSNEASTEATNYKTEDANVANVVPKEKVNYYDETEKLNQDSIEAKLRRINSGQSTNNQSNAKEQTKSNDPVIYFDNRIINQQPQTNPQPDPVIYFDNRIQGGSQPK